MIDGLLRQTALNDLNDVEAVISQDFQGERTMAMIAYLSELVDICADDLENAQDDAERQVASRVLEGLYAAQRMITDFWESTHRAQLTLPRAWHGL